MSAPDAPSTQGQAAPADAGVNTGNNPGLPHPMPRPDSPGGGPLGSMVGTHTIRDAVESTLTARIDSYLAEAERQNPHIVNPGLVGFHTWLNQPGASTVNPVNAPNYVILVPGMLGPPRRKGDGSHSATWLVRLQVWLYGRAWREVDDRIGAYLAATRVCLLQNPTLGGAARSVTWRGETVAPVQQQPGATRTWGQGVLEFAVYCDPVAHAYAGPAPLDPTVLPPDPIAATGFGVTVSVQPAP